MSVGAYVSLCVCDSDSTGETVDRSNPAAAHFCNPPSKKTVFDPLSLLLPHCPAGKVTKSLWFCVKEEGWGGVVRERERGFFFFFRSTTGGEGRPGE